MHPHLFKKKWNQSCPKKIIKKYANTLDVPFKEVPMCKHKHDINIFWGENLKEKKKSNKGNFWSVQKILKRKIF